MTLPFTDLKSFYRSLVSQDNLSLLEKQALKKGTDYFACIHVPTIKPWFAA